MASAPLRRLRGVWRETGRPRWREVRPVAIVGVAATVIVLGTIGFSQYEDLHNHVHYSLLDSLYRSFQLFGFGATLDPPVPTTLQVARFLGPLIAGYAVIRGLLALSREQAQLLWVRVVYRNHVVVTGLGTVGGRMATDLYDKGYRVLVIERANDNPAIPGCRERGIPVICGDARDPAILRQARVDRAARMAITCGEDGTNIDVATAAGQMLADRGSGVVTALVHLDDFGLLGMMRAQALTATGAFAFRLALFNVADTASQMLVERHHPFGTDRRAEHRVLVLGLETLGRSLVLQILQRWKMEAPADRTLAITVAGPAAEAELGRLRIRHPEVDQVPAARIEAWNVMLDSIELRGWERSPAEVTYVCLADESQALATGLALGSGAGEGSLVVVVVPDESSGVATTLATDGPLLKRVTPFGVLTHACAEEAFLHTTNEQIAKASHEVHLRSQEEQGRGVAEDPSLVDWEQLPERLRESNRLFADSIPSKLAEIGCVVEPAPLAAPADAAVQFSLAEVERLARMEHDRWSEDVQRHLGYRPTAGEKDTAQGLHPLIGVPYDQLPEESREKDSVKVRSIPEVLALAGFRIARTAEHRHTAGLPAGVS
jgi:TrkA-N domain